MSEDEFTRMAGPETRALVQDLTSELPRVMACTAPAPGLVFGDSRPALRAVAGLPPRLRWWERLETWVWGKLVEMLSKR